MILGPKIIRQTPYDPARTKHLNELRSQWLEAYKAKDASKMSLLDRQIQDEAFRVYVPEALRRKLEKEHKRILDLEIVEK